MIKVELTYVEMLVGCIIAGAQVARGLASGSEHRWNGGRNPYITESNIFARQGEIAVCKYFNLYWSGVNKGANDVGGFIEVRTGALHHYKMPLHPDDKDNLPYVWVTAQDAPIFYLHGWCYGRDGKNQKYWSDPAKDNRPAFFVPPCDLLPIETLRVSIVFDLSGELALEAAQ